MWLWWTIDFEQYKLCTYSSFNETLCSTFRGYHYIVCAPSLFSPVFVWFGLVWSGLVWSGLVWFSLVWSGLVSLWLPFLIGINLLIIYRRVRVWHEISVTCVLRMYRAPRTMISCNVPLAGITSYLTRKSSAMRLEVCCIEAWWRERGERI